MNKKVLVLSLVLFSILAFGWQRGQAQAGPLIPRAADGPSGTYAGPGLRYSGEAFWGFTQDNLWDPTMWTEDLLPLFREQHLALGPWGLGWCTAASILLLRYPHACAGRRAPPRWPGHTGDPAPHVVRGCWYSPGYSL